ncbi:hypothetical protein ADL35_47100, partial [Streptomyces sp. NRRL WC-3753]
MVRDEQQAGGAAVLQAGEQDGAQQRGPGQVQARLDGTGHLQQPRLARLLGVRGQVLGVTRDLVRYGGQFRLPGAVLLEEAGAQSVVLLQHPAHHRPPLLRRQPRLHLHQHRLIDMPGNSEVLSEEPPL